MPRYFFHLYNDVDTDDLEGCELPDLAAAEAHGLREARHMAAERVSEGHLDLRHRLEIVDAHGQVLRTIRFGDAVTIVPRRHPAGARPPGRGAGKAR